MKIVTTIADAQEQQRAKGRVLVPTMGAVHKGYGELIRVARKGAGNDGAVAISTWILVS